MPHSPWALDRLPPRTSRWDRGACDGNEEIVRCMEERDEPPAMDVGLCSGDGVRYDGASPGSTAPAGAGLLGRWCRNADRRHGLAAVRPVRHGCRRHRALQRDPGRGRRGRPLHRLRGRHDAPRPGAVPRQRDDLGRNRHRRWHGASAFPPRHRPLRRFRGARRQRHDTRRKRRSRLPESRLRHLHGGKLHPRHRGGRHGHVRDRRRLGR